METRACWRRRRNGLGDKRGLTLMVALAFAGAILSGCGSETPSQDPLRSQAIPGADSFEESVDPLEAYRQQDPRKQAVTGVRYVSMGMMLFQMHVGRLPTEDEGIRAMWEEPEAVRGTNKWRGPYNDKSVVEEDPWGNPYEYRQDPSLDLGFEVASHGPDGKPGNDDILASEEANLPNFAKQAEQYGMGSFQGSGSSEDTSDSAPIPGIVDKPD